MKLPFSWLSEMVDLTGLTADQVAEKLTMGAFEVEEVRPFGPDIQGPVVVGQIVAISPHPDPTVTRVRLTKTIVKEGAEPLDIVCGAQNIEVGQVVPVSLPGAKVVDRKTGKALEIKSSTIRGAQSNGMLCSPPELGLTDGDGEGILILSTDLSRYRLGDDVKELLALYQDEILNVAPRSNRGDALSIAGLAREVAALTKRPLKARVAEFDFSKIAQSETPRITIDSKEDCLLFTARRIDNIKVGESPALIKRRLESVGMRSINNLVDISNYVMIEYGQPTHAYDASFVDGQHFIVRRAKKDEKITTLDGKERNLSPELLVIADESKVIGLAGVMGGLNSEVLDSTTTVLLEAAIFDKARVRRACRLLGLTSEASQRFERGLDIENTRYASDRAAELILKYCSNGQLDSCHGFAKAGVDKLSEKSIALRLSQLPRFLDIKPPQDEVESLLAPLGFVAKEKNAEAQTITFAIPSFRQGDVEREIDLVEEVARIYGFENLPVSMPAKTISASPKDSLLDDLRYFLKGQGLNEAYCSSLVPVEAAEGEGDKNNAFGFENKESLVQVLNPLSKDHEALRQSLLPGLLKAIAYNSAHGEKDAWLFEVGRLYLKTADLKERIKAGGNKEGKTIGQFVDEPLYLSGVLSGLPSLSPWTLSAKNNEPSSTAHKEGQNGNQPGAESGGGKKNLAVTPLQFDFFNLKGLLENLFESLHIKADRLEFQTETSPLPAFHPGKTARLILKPYKPTEPDILVGRLGELHPAMARRLTIEKPTYIFELNIDALKALKTKSSMKAIATAPAVSRDLTVDLDAQVEQGKVAALIKQSAGKTFKELELVSIFALSDAVKSLSYRLTFQHPEETLKAEEVEAQLLKIRQSLTDSVGGKFRL